MILGVLAVEVLAFLLVAAHVDEELGEVEVFLVAGGTVESDEADLDFFVAGHVGELSGVGAEYLGDEVGVLDSDVEEVSFAGGLVVGDGCFVHMAHVVEFMAVIQAGPAGIATVAAFGAGGLGGVEIAVFFLGGGELGNEIVEVLIQFGIVFECQCVGGSLDDFEDVGVVEEDSLELIRIFFCRCDKICDSSRLFATFETIGHGHLSIRLHARRPESWPDFDGSERDGLDWIVGDVGRPCGRCEKQQKNGGLCGRFHGLWIR